MLILTRRVGEKLYVGDENISITVLKVTGHQVKLGIVAPKNMTVLREEVLLKIQSQKKKTAPS